METNSSKNKENSFKTFLKWFFGIIILLTAISVLSNHHYLSFFFYFVSAFICIPFTYSLLKKELSSIVKYVIVIFFFILGFLAVPKSNKTISNNKTNNSSKINEEKKDPYIELNKQLDIEILAFEKPFNRGNIGYKGLLNMFKGYDETIELSSSKYNKIDSINKKSDILKSHVQKLQIKYFPIIRKEYVKDIESKLWEQNIDVKCLGSDCNTIRFISGIYANNKNIKESYIALIDNLEIMRFKKVEFLWYKHDDEYTYYKIDSKKDNE